MTAPLDEKAEHPRIWLEPAGAPDRCWCSDNQWGDEGVEYLLAAQAQSALAAMRVERDEALLCQQEIAAGSGQSATVARIIIAKNEAEDRAETAEAEVTRLTQALSEIRELNMSSEDENGHRWANSDLIEQTIVFTMAGARKAMESGE